MMSSENFSFRILIIKASQFIIDQFLRISRKSVYERSDNEN